MRSFFHNFDSRSFFHRIRSIPDFRDFELLDQFFRGKQREAEKSLGAVPISFCLLVNVLTEQNTIHTISKDFWQRKCQNIRQKLLASDTLAERYKKDSYVPAEGPRTFWTSLDFPSKESTPEKVPASGILSGLGAAKSKETNKPSEQGDPTWPDLNELNNGNGLIDH